MENTIKLIARQKIGQYLKEMRLSKGITTYQMTKEYGIRFEAISAIEEGSSNYTIDNFLAYIAALDCYFYLKGREGKHGDLEDMISKA